MTRIYDKTQQSTKNAINVVVAAVVVGILSLVVFGSGIVL
jgi:hypothetical protein